MMMAIDFLGTLIMFMGFIIGLGSVTVIDIHGFLGRTSPYWTEATIRTHKITKPLSRLFGLEQYWRLSVV